MNRPLRHLILCALVLATLLPDARASSLAKPPLSHSRLKQLVMEFGMERRNDSVFRRAGLATVLPRLAEFQRSMPPETRLAYFTAFTLAYFRRDYGRNVERLTYCFELWDADVKKWQAYLDRAGTWEETRLDVPFLIARLYRRHRDPGLVRRIFSWGLDGAAAEGASYERVQLLTDYPLAVLNTVQPSQRMTRMALDSLCNGVGADKNEYERALANILRSSRRAQPPLRGFMRQFVRQARARGWSG